MTSSTTPNPTAEWIKTTRYPHSLWYLVCWPCILFGPSSFLYCLNWGIKRGILKWGMTGFLKKTLFLKSDLTVPSVQRKLELQQDISTWKSVPYIFKQLLSQIKGTEPIFIPSKVDCNQCSIKCCLLLKLQQRQISRQPMTFDTRKYEDKNVRRYRFGLLR